MKGLRTWTGLFFAIVLGLSLAACGGNSKQEVADQKARDEAVVKATAEQQKQREEADKKAEAERKEQQDRERAERRAELNKSIRAAFDPKAEETWRSDRPTWVVELHRGSPQPATDTCRKSERFREISWALDAMESDTWGRISWSEIDLEERQARKLHRETGLAAAKSLLAFFSLPRETRQKMWCGRGEGSFNLGESLWLMGDISRILQEIKAEPKDIGSSPTMLRRVLLKDLQEQIAYLRREVGAGKTDASGIKNVAREATEEWGFTPIELGLTTEEIAMLQKKE